MATDELTAGDVEHPAEQYQEILRSPGVRLVDAHGHEAPLSGAAASFLASSLTAACGGRALLLTEDDTMTPLQAAKVLGVSRPMVYQFIRDGLLEDRPVGTHHRIPAGSVHQLAAERRRAADHAAALLRDQPDHPRVQAAHERVRARRAARQA